MDLKKFGEIVMKNVDEKQLAIDLAKEFILPFLSKVVADTDNKFDDLAMAEIIKYIESKM